MPAEVVNEPRYWWAGRLAPTLVVQAVVTGAGERGVVLGDVDAPLRLSPAEAVEIGEALIAAGREMARERVETIKERADA